VSFRHNKKMFNIFTGKVKSFKERFFLVRSRSEAALNNHLTAAEEPSSVDGEAAAHTLYFPLSWSKEHYNYESRDYGRSVTRLTEEEREAHNKLWAYVKSFSPATAVGLEGNSVIEPRLINTHDLVLFENMMDLLGRYPFLHTFM